MATITNALNLELPADGEQDGIWGTTANTNYQKLEAKISSVLTLNLATIATSYTLGRSDSAVSENESAIIKFTNIATESKTIILNDDFSGFFVIKLAAGALTSGRTITVKNSSSATEDEATITQDLNGSSFILYSDGVTCEILSDSKPSLIVDEIRMYSGDVSSLPDGWYLCDGTNGTVDLTGRFIVGYDATGTDDTISPIQTEGGSLSPATSTNSIAISGDTESHSLASNEIPSHFHYVAHNSTSTDPSEPDASSGHSIRRSWRQDSGSPAGFDFAYNLKDSGTSAASVGRTSTAGGTGGHSHTLNLAGVGSHSHTVPDVRPPFMALAFIQYKG